MYVTPIPGVLLLTLSRHLTKGCLDHSLPSPPFGVGVGHAPGAERGTIQVHLEVDQGELRGHGALRFPAALLLQAPSFFGFETIRISASLLNPSTTVFLSLM